ncbi:hypothetical protein D3C80_1632060 [compost metagenome]
MQQSGTGLRRIIEGVDEGLHHRAHNIDNPQVQPDCFLTDHLPELRLHQGVGDKTLQLRRFLHQLAEFILVPYIAVSPDRDTLILELVDNGLHYCFCRIAY